MKYSRSMARSVLAAALVLLVCGAMADVQLPALIGDNMVLQADIGVSIWGTADPQEEVTVAIAGQSRTARADDNGHWLVELEPMQVGGPHKMTISANNEITISNVMVGEVWVCSGQSNMQWPVRAVYNAKAEIQKADYPNIRLFSVKRTTSETPLDDVEGQWQRCTPQTVPGFTAVGYFFGRELHKRLNVPIGLIHSSWGGTPAEAWTSRQKLESIDELKPILERWERILENHPQAMEKYRNETLPNWEKKKKEAEQAGKQPPRRPRPPLGPNSPHRPASLYNAMIAPLLNYPIKGAIWYQGESNAGRAYQYRTLFPAMIRDWRERWDVGDFPFLFVQLANFMQVEPYPAESAWAELREAQLMTLDLPNTGMAVTIEIGEADDIHPKNKQDVGKRLAMAAMGVAYGKDVPYSSPLYESMSVEGDRIRVHFKHTFGGLNTPKDAPVNGFAIAGEDRQFKWAHAEIDGDSVVVWSYEVDDPVAVRYGWGNNPVCNLYNAGGLPASPFRTDDWPGVTINNK